MSGLPDPVRFAPDRIKAREGVESVPQRLKPVVFVPLTARLKSCPSRSVLLVCTTSAAQWGSRGVPTLATRP
jgi:hypothetical protein